jgi:hypothetical protein
VNGQIRSGALRPFPGPHQIAVLPRDRPQLHLGVEPGSTSLRNEPEQLAADIPAWIA